MAAPTLLGREPEVTAIDAFLADRAALPRALLIEGEPGSGKTSVWREAVNHAHATGYRVLSCRPAGTEVQLSFGGIADLLAGSLDDLLPALPPPQRRAVEVALLLRGDGGEAPDPRAVAAGLLTSIRRLAASGDLLLAIDDAQWLDGPTVSTLEYALRRLEAEPVAVIAAYRPAGSGWEAPGSARRLDLGQTLATAPIPLRLGPLSLGAIRRIVQSRTDLQPNRRTLQRIHETADGNPFYAIELARALERGVAGWLPGEPLPLTVGLRELLAERHADLGEGARDALLVSASAARPTRQLVASVVGAPVEELLGPAVDAGIVRLDGDRVTFTHPLLAASVYSGATVAARARCHRRLAEVVGDPEESARHLALAQPGSDREVASRLHDAAMHARLRGAVPAAAELFDQAIARLPTDDVELRASWAVEAAPVIRAAGDAPRARAHLETALPSLPDGGPRSDALLLLAGLVAADMDGSRRERDLIDEALLEAGDDPRRRAAALLRLEMWERHRDRFAAALPLAREAADLAERSGDEALLARALTRTADLEVLLGTVEEPVAHFARALDVGRRHRPDGPDDAAPTMLSACLIRAGRVAEARVLLQSERARVIAEGDEATLEMLAVLLTELEWLAGNWDDAVAYADEGLDVARAAGSRTLEGALTGLQALVAAARGEFGLARAGVASALALSESTGDLSYIVYARQVLGFLELSSGDAAAAHAAVPPYSVERGVEGTKRLSFVGDEIESLVLLGHIDAAEALTTELHQRGATLRRETLAATAQRCRALVLGARGDFDAAITAAGTSVDTWERLALPFERARALLVLGEVQRRAKRRGDARATLTAAADTFEALGATPWAERARAERARVGGRTRIEGLTETELRVAELAGAGQSNKEIAAALFVTVRAVEANLSRVYAKLGIRTRTELARRL